jgi:hypothetical protein
MLNNLKTEGRLGEAAFKLDYFAASLAVNYNIASGMVASGKIS